MSLNENSSRDQILKYIKKTPFYFLYNFSHKPWAQLYIGEASKGAVKENPYSFLFYFSDKPWAQPYIDKAAKVAAKKEPKYFLENLSNRFPQCINTALFALGNKNDSK